MEDLTELEHGVDHLRLVLAVGEIGVWDLDAATGEAWRSLRHDQIFGYDTPRESWSYDDFLAHVVEEDRPRVDAAYGAALAAKQSWSFDCRILRADGKLCWISAHGRHLQDPQTGHERLIGHVLDITDRKEAEERLRLVTSELNHRTRNMLSVLQGMVRMSARRADTVAELEHSLLGRMEALSRSHALTVQLSEGALRVSDVIDSALSPFQPEPGRIVVSGATGATLLPKISESLSLALYELTTNAIKYGALSNDAGRVLIEVNRLAPGRARVVWRESGGPRVAPPERMGFGSTLLRSILRADEGEVRMDYAEAGVVCTIEMPVGHDAAESERATRGEARLEGRRVMVVEDEFLIAISLEMALGEQGALVEGPYTRLAEAREAVSTRPDAAVLDVRLGSESSLPLARDLASLGVPLLFVTGNVDGEELKQEFPDAQVLSKPVSEDRVVAELKRLIESRPAGR
ncbi:MAG: PAS domain S-box-containing protein [Limimaricola cinnabarinus]|jgi:PAS domain S-box-containing protein|uniref:histidine kinase n=1 Tax=Limimaricola cinnabarinus LL-001 TaxID=1337093 RepID=U3AN54_9RHOB|nr:HWE histidine kinase domain-containing protein [Limimaricola cinnabarinus]GAD56178.1 two-component system regulatory protein [Limimaricola cinnabarinus LL-001]